MARDLLSGRERSNQILEAKSKMSLFSGAVVPEPSVIEALARGDGDAAVALFSGPSKDPVKKVRFDPSSIPRDAQGRVSDVRVGPGHVELPMRPPKVHRSMGSNSLCGKTPSFKMLKSRAGHIRSDTRDDT